MSISSWIYDGFKQVCAESIIFSPQEDWREVGSTITIGPCVSKRLCIARLNRSNSGAKGVDTASGEVEQSDKVCEIVDTLVEALWFSHVNKN